jgi:nitrite reductase/ring-hydroxylating ferredoxin subunit
MDWHPLNDITPREVSEKTEGKIFHTKVKGRRLAVSFSQGKWRAFSSRCPHAGGPLQSGKINENGEIVCPLHRFAFNLESGKCDSGGYFIDIFECKEERFELSVKLPKKKFLGLF